MKELTSNYAGLVLRNPIVAASSGLTASAAKVKELANAGCAAVVIKSLFEEQIDNMSCNVANQGEYYPEAYDYVNHYIKGHEVQKHLDLIKQAKDENEIPIIASINCYHRGDWADFATQLEKSGADALEVNIMRLESSLTADPGKVVEEYVDIVRSVVKAVSVPVEVKISKYFSCPLSLIASLRQAGAKGVTLFNRSYRMDVDVEKEAITTGNIFTEPQDIADTLRYVGIAAAELKDFPVSASTGVHGYICALKALLVGAQTVQMCSSLYKNGVDQVQRTLAGIEEWMERKQYRSIDEFRGKLKAAEEDQALYGRMQFMRYFSQAE